MGEYFHGWKRKAGLVTLAVACVLMVVWVRSRSLVDDYTTVNGTQPDRYRIRSGADQNTLISEHNELNWNRGGWGFRCIQAKDRMNCPHGYHFEINAHTFDCDTNFRFCGFDCGFLREVGQPTTRRFRATF